MSFLKNLLKREAREEQKRVERVSPLKFAPFIVVTNRGRRFEVAGRLRPEQLRRLSVIYWVARACIDFRSTQITQLGWTIKSREGSKQADEEIINFFRSIGGRRFRYFVDSCLDDLLVLDAVAIYKERNRRGDIVGFLPIDAATIRVIVDESGRIPDPPEPAYEQVVRGEVVARLTKDELYYDMLNPRTYSPYGLAPLESLIIQVATALRIDDYNLSYLTEGNIPEGFIFLPESVASSVQEIEQWQRWFDAFVSGDLGMMRRLKALPGEARYQEIKKPDDMDFKQFQLFLLTATCAAFGVPPYNIGVTESVYKVSGEVQIELGRDRGLRPLANFFKELFDQMLVDLGHDDLEFIWTTLEAKDRKIEAEIARQMIPIGAMSVDEWRISEGKEPIGLSNYINTPAGPVLVEDLFPLKKQVVSGIEVEKAELMKWRRKAVNDFKKGLPFRPFFSDVLSPSLIDEIQFLLDGASSEGEIHNIFERYIRGDRKSFEAELLSKLVKVKTNEKKDDLLEEVKAILNGRAYTS